MVALIAAISLPAQNHDGLFTNSVGEQYKVVMHSDLGKSRYGYAIECWSIINGKGVIWINDKDLRKFFDALYNIQFRFTQLREAALTYKNVSQLKEKIKVKFPKTQFYLGGQPYGSGHLDAEFSMPSPGIDFVTCSAYVDAKKIDFSDKRLAGNLFSQRFGAPEDIDNLIYAILHCPTRQSVWPI